MLFLNRHDAGRRLAARLRHLEGEPVVVLGLPRGGVPVAFEVAEALGAPLDVIVVRKLGVPFQPELGMGAIGEDGVRIINESVMRMARVSEDELARVEMDERLELERRARRFRGDRPRVPLDDRTAVIVDDGIATGSTARAACQVARAHGAARVVLAVPVAPPEWTDRMAGAADEYISLETPDPFYAIGQFYADFAQTGDPEVVDLLERATRTDDRSDDEPAPVAGGGITDCPVRVPAAGAELDGELTLPPNAPGIVVFAHGSGSSRHSPRNRFVAEVLESSGLGTLLFDLLTAEEEYDRSNVFDVDLLAGRLADATRWLEDRPEAADLPIGYFGASTGAAAALVAAADLGDRISAVVSRGGRPDLASPRLGEVTAPTLLIVGGRDIEVLALNRRAEADLRCVSELVVVPGATHLFEEPGALRSAAEEARDWFVEHLTRGGERSR